MSYDENNDFIDKIQSPNTEEGNRLVSIADWTGMLGMFPVYMGMFQMMVEDPVTKLNGMIIFMFGLLVVGFSMYGLQVVAAYHVQGKKYPINYVFYGDRMVLRNMELTNDPLVVAKLDADDEVIILDDDDDYRMLFRALGSDFLTDKEVKEKIRNAAIESFEKDKAKIAEKPNKRKWGIKRGK